MWRKTPNVQAHFIFQLSKLKQVRLGGKETYVTKQHIFLAAKLMGKYKGGKEL